MKFDEIYKKVTDAQRAFEERHIPISLDFKLEDLRDALVESNDTIEKLKQNLEDAKATAYTDSVDAGMENRRLKRALWLARSYRGRDNSILLPSKFMRNVWDNVERKCRDKAEEYE